MGCALIASNRGRQRIIIETLLLSFFSFSLCTLYIIVLPSSRAKIQYWHLIHFDSEDCSLVDSKEGLLEQY